MSKSLVAWANYLEHENEPSQAHYAVKAIQAYASEGKPIPEELLPYLVKVCDVWFKDQGYRSSKPNTKDKWLKLIAKVDLLRNMDDFEGLTKMTLEGAIEMVSSEPENNCTLGSLTTKYSSKKDFPDSDRSSARGDLLNQLLK